jgi:hypothetical protein
MKIVLIMIITFYFVFILKKYKKEMFVDNHDNNHSDNQHNNQFNMIQISQLKNQQQIQRVDITENDKNIKENSKKINGILSILHEIKTG